MDCLNEQSILAAISLNVLHPPESPPAQSLIAYALFLHILHHFLGGLIQHTLLSPRLALPLFPMIDSTLSWAYLVGHHGPKLLYNTKRIVEKGHCGV
jgi:hypothetical protein